MASHTVTEHSRGVIPVHLVDGERQYLLLKHGKGHWGFPKGHAQAGESHRDTALRELAEETGISDVELLDQPPLEEQYWLTRKGRRVHKTVTYFIGFVADPTVRPQPEEIDDYAWGDAAATRERITYDQSSRLLERAEAAFNG